MKQSGARQAEKNGHWRGGRVETLGGYVRVYDRNHPRSHNRHIFEHILVWEQTHKQSLPIGWIIHHINGVKDDNRIENLLAMPRKNHSAGLYIKTLQERIRELEGKLQQAIIDDTCLVKE